MPVTPNDILVSSAKVFNGATRSLKRSLLELNRRTCSPTKQATIIRGSTPQAAAATVAERSGAISGQVGGEVLGVVENMSYLDTPQGKLEIFGSGGGQSVADALSRKTGKPVSVLTQLPIDPELRAASDLGEPLVWSNPANPTAKLISQLAKKLASVPRGLSGKRLDISLR